MNKTLYITVLVLITYSPGLWTLALAQTRHHDEPNDNAYSATFLFDGRKIDFSGTSTHADFPTTYSFFLERSGAIGCGIHVLGLETEPVAGIYLLGIDENPKAGAVCVRQDDEIRERISSRSGHFTIEEIDNRTISGSFEIKMIGDISGIEYTLQGDYVSRSRR